MKISFVNSFKLLLRYNLIEFCDWQKKNIFDLRQIFLKCKAYEKVYQIKKSHSKVKKTKRKINRIWIFTGTYTTKLLENYIVSKQ